MKKLLKEDAMQRQERLKKLVEVGDKAKQQLGIADKPKEKDVNRHKWKGSM